MDGYEFLRTFEENPVKAIDIYDALHKYYGYCFDAANNHQLDFMRFKNQCIMSKRRTIHQIYKRGYDGKD
jgi:hypothetical protein